mmetsp:Transcript_61464/g.165127  ORF Transcript_61464/g.165127 Transcript_61464/m.165127 type:complete len:265 (+) Transcript_61464:485-1279(+)
MMLSRNVHCSKTRQGIGVRVEPYKQNCSEPHQDALHLAAFLKKTSCGAAAQAQLKWTTDRHNTVKTYKGCAVLNPGHLFSIHHRIGCFDFFSSSCFIIERTTVLVRIPMDWAESISTTASKTCESHLLVALKATISCRLLGRRLSNLLSFSSNSSTCRLCDHRNLADAGSSGLMFHFRLRNIRFRSFRCNRSRGRWSLFCHLKSPLEFFLAMSFLEANRTIVVERGRSKKPATSSTRFRGVTIRLCALHNLCSSSSITSPSDSM